MKVGAVRLAAAMRRAALRDAGRISAEPRIYRRKMSEEATDMPQGLSFIGWLLHQSLSLLAGSSREQPLTLWCWGGGTASMTGTTADSSISSVGKTYMPVSTYRGQTEFLLSVLFLTKTPPTPPHSHHATIFDLLSHTYFSGWR